MRYEQVVWVVVAKDSQGRPRGFEETFNERFYLIEAEAQLEHVAMAPELKPFFVVAEARIGYPGEPGGLAGHEELVKNALSQPDWVYTKPKA